ncbi:hypothetical protein VDGD_21124 [Verticillium dahliae]|nr:hypothetical protein VDGD_21124 [Verticillium dahliae]
MPLVVVQLGHGLDAVVLADDARNVGRAVEAAEARHDAADPRLDLVPLRHVDPGQGERGGGRLGGEEGLGAREGAGVDVGDADCAAAGGDLLGCRETYAAGAPRDGVDFACEGHLGGWGGGGNWPTEGC